MQTVTIKETKRIQSMEENLMKQKLFLFHSLCSFLILKTSINMSFHLELVSELEKVFLLQTSSVGNRCFRQNLTPESLQVRLLAKVRVSLQRFTGQTGFFFFSWITISSSFVFYKQRFDSLFVRTSFNGYRTCFAYRNRYAPVI